MEDSQQAAVGWASNAKGHASWSAVFHDNWMFSARTTIPALQVHDFCRQCSRGNCTAECGKKARAYRGVAFVFILNAVASDAMKKRDHFGLDTHKPRRYASALIFHRTNDNSPTRWSLRLSTIYPLCLLSSPSYRAPSLAYRPGFGSQENRPRHRSWHRRRAGTNAGSQLTGAGRACDHRGAGQRYRGHGSGECAAHGLAGEPVRHSGSRRRSASFVSEIDYGRVLAWQEWPS